MDQFVIITVKISNRCWTLVSKDVGHQPFGHSMVSSTSQWQKLNFCASKLENIGPRWIGGLIHDWMENFKISFLWMKLNSFPSYLSVQDMQTKPVYF